MRECICFETAPQPNPGLTVHVLHSAFFCLAKFEYSRIIFYSWSGDTVSMSPSVFLVVLHDLDGHEPCRYVNSSGIWQHKNDPYSMYKYSSFGATGVTIL